MILRDEKPVFDITEGDHRIVAWYLTEPKGDALVEITRDGELLRSFRWPAYKVWNIAAHARDLVANLEQGLRVAGSDGLGGGVVPRDVP